PYYLKVNWNLDRDVLAAHGIEPEYTDIWGHTHTTSDAAAHAIIASLGSPQDSTQAIASTIVVREDADHLRVRIPADRTGLSIKLEIGWESGEKEHHWFFLPELPDLDRQGEVVFKRVPLPKLRLGYHRLLLYWMKEPELETFASARLIVCPRRVYGID